MGQLHERLPDDLEVSAFYSLSLLGISRGERDIPNYMRAAAVAEEVYQRSPRHPGALHYLIHCFDDPVHAPLGLPMARAYGQVAPAAAHALHMPSHIFVALGMWEDSAAANVASAAAADARLARKKLGVEERGYHSLWWLAYTDLQLGRYADARALVERMNDDAQGERLGQDPPAPRAHARGVRARHRGVGRSAREAAGEHVGTGAEHGRGGSARARL
jgi:hypothetical protein